MFDCDLERKGGLTHELWHLIRVLLSRGGCRQVAP